MIFRRKIVANDTKSATTRGAKNKNADCIKISVLICNLHLFLGLVVIRIINALHDNLAVVNIIGQGVFYERIDIARIGDAFAHGGEIYLPFLRVQQVVDAETSAF